MISLLDPADLDAVRDLRRALHEHHAALPTPPGFAVRDPDEAWRAWRASVAPILAADDAAVFVHRDAAGSPDGMAYVRVLDKPSLLRPVLEPTDLHGELVTLVVADGARGAGIGEALTTAAAGWCRERGLAAMHVVVRSDNEGAMRFYLTHDARPGWQTLIVAL